MRCYNHPERDAVGSCKSCCKGLCAECAVDLGHGLSCRGEHEERVKAIDRMMSRAARVQATAKFSRYVAPTFYGFMGAVFCGYGLLYARTGNFLILLGAGFLVFAAYAFFANRRAYGKKESDA